MARQYEVCYVMLEEITLQPQALMEEVDTIYAHGIASNRLYFESMLIEKALELGRT